MKLKEAIERYVAHKQSLGMHFKTSGRILRAFAKSIGECDLETVPPEGVKLFIYGTGPVTSTLHTKHTAVRGLYRYLLNRGFVANSPVPTEIPKAPEKFIPHIYTPDELRRIFAAAGQQRHQQCKLEAHTLTVLVLLLYGAALRVSEALRLTLADVDLDQNVLTIRDTKFFKTRWVPIGPDLRRALDSYLKIRAKRKHPAPPEAFLLLTRESQPVNIQLAELSFKRLCAVAKVHRNDKNRFGPRLHDLRHSFAVHRLIACYREGEEVGRFLFYLSNYLGHVDLRSTQRYLMVTPELLRHASNRFQKYAMNGGQS